MKTLKKCPSCKYERCWSRAKVCEMCDYDFILGRKPRKKKQEDFDDDEIPVIKEQPKELPKVIHKICPACKYDKCWHSAPMCEKCDYDFVLGKKVLTDEAVEAVPETRRFLGYSPDWKSIHQPWMDEFTGPWERKFVLADNKVAYGVGDEQALRAWCVTMKTKVPVVMGKSVLLYSGCLEQYAEVSKNPLLREAAAQIGEWYSPKTGVSEKTWDSKIGAWRHEMLTSLEQSAAYAKLMTNKLWVSKDKGYSVMTAKEAAEYRESEAKKGRFYLAFGSTVRLIPKEWNKWSDQERLKWVSSQPGSPTEPVPGKLKNP